MKFTIKKEVLMEAINKVSKAIGSSFGNLFGSEDVDF